MKKLTILIAMLMASSAWAGIVNLSCYTDKAKIMKGGYEYDDFNITLRLDTEKETVTAVSLTTKYYVRNDPNEIGFSRDNSVAYITYKLNRLNGNLHVDRIPLDGNTPIIYWNYKCQKADPLF
ncbi:hypothetical protein OAK06_07950 [Gammaproteobacteria bacterium]|nr:hypothetical protein [Gammaproteobacteria bacterium]